MSYSVLNGLAEAMKALDGKKARFFHVDSDFRQGHGSGSVDRKCNNSDVSSGAITGSSLPLGDIAWPLLRILALPRP